MPPSGGVVADTLRDLLARSGVLAHVVLPPEPDAVLAELEVTSAPQDLGGGIGTGGVALVHDLSKSPIPGFDFGLAVPEPGITFPFKFKLEPPDAPTASKAWLQLADEKHALAVFTFVEGVPSYALTGAAKVVDPDGSARLQALPAGAFWSSPFFGGTSGASPIITGLCLLIQDLQMLLTPKPGRAGRLGPATMRAIIANAANRTAIQASIGPMPDGAKVIANEYVGPP